MYSVPMYDPFARGPYPVSVRSEELRDPARNQRAVPIELWQPSQPRYFGQDLDKNTQDRYPIFGGFQVRQDAVRDAELCDGDFPVVLFSHGFAGHRRQSTFFCTHLASHGYRVIACDHGGNTLADMLKLTLGLDGGPLPKDLAQMLGSYVFDRPRDLTFILDSVEQGKVSALPASVKVEHVGVSGHSFGGWTTLVTAGKDTRVRAALPMAPAGGPGPLHARALSDALDLDFEGGVDTLYLALERDSLLPLEGIETLFQRTSSPKRMWVLLNADHMHFCDRVERSHEFFRTMPQIGPMKEVAKNLPPMAELAPGEHGYLFARGLGTAQFDAVLKQSDEAQQFLSSGVEAALTARGIGATPR